MDAGKATTVALYAKVERRRHQCELQQWHNATLSNDVTIAVLRRQQAEQLLSFIFQSEPFCDTRSQVDLAQLDLHLSDDVAAPERGCIILH